METTIKTAPWILLFVLFVWAFPPARLCAEINPQAFLDTIAQIETGGRDVRGARGECSRWQLMPAVWSQHSNKPFACSHAEAERIAFAHLTWIRNQLANNGLPDDPFLAAAAWHGGLAGANKALQYHHRPELEDYAHRAHTAPAPNLIFVAAQPFQTQTVLFKIL
jgi:hypothetical protein